MAPSFPPRRFPQPSTLIPLLLVLGSGLAPLELAGARPALSAAALPAPAPAPARAAAAAQDAPPPGEGSEDPVPQGRNLDREVGQFLAEYEQVLDAWLQGRSLLREGSREPAHPVTEFFPRMLEFGERGYRGADDWLLEHLELARLAPEARRELRADLVRRLLDPKRAPEDPEWILLELARCGGELEPATSRSLANHWLRSSADTNVKAAAMWVLAEAASDMGASADPGAWLEADQLLTRLLEIAPESAAGRLAAPRLGDLMQRRFDADMNDWWQLFTQGDETPDPSTHPARSWWPRFEALGERGIGRSLWWLVLHAEKQGLDDAERRALRVDLMDRIIANHADEDWLVEAVKESGRMVDELSRDVVVSLGEQLLAKSRNEDVLAWTLYQMAELAAADEADVPRVERAIALLERLAREHPRHQLARSAEPRIFELRHLRVGQVVPEMEVVLDGDESLRLSDYRGKVLAVVFWSFWSGASEEDLVLLEGLERSLTGRPFQVLGLNLDPDVERAAGETRAAGAKFRNLWLGGASHYWPQTWNVRHFPKVFLVDPAGRLRSKELTLGELGEAVRELLDEDPPGPSSSGDPAGDGAVPSADREPPGPDVQGG